MAQKWIHLNGRQLCRCFNSPPFWKGIFSDTRQTIHMKCQGLFSLESNNNKKNRLSAATILHSTLTVNIFSIIIDAQRTKSPYTICGQCRSRLACAFMQSDPRRGIEGGGGWVGNLGVIVVWVCEPEFRNLPHFIYLAFEKSTHSYTWSSKMLTYSYTGLCFSVPIYCW